MIVRMVHPDHGATHVYDTGELEKLKKLGWSVEGEKSPAENHVELVKAAIEATPPVVPEKRKPGRPAKAKP